MGVHAYRSNDAYDPGSTCRVGWMESRRKWRLLLALTPARVVNPGVSSVLLRVPILMKDSSPRAESHYDRYQLDAQGTLPKVPLWDTLCLHAIWKEKEDNTSLASERAAFLSRLVGPGASQQLEQQLRFRLVVPRGQDITYIPYINNHYPAELRGCAAWLSCTAGLPPCTEHLTQGASIDVPDGVLDDAPLAVISGVNAWVTACLLSSPVQKSTDKHDEGWHSLFLETLQKWFEAFPKYPLPNLSVEGVAFCAELCFDCGPHWVFGNRKLKRSLKTFVAVAIFLRKKSVLLHCCRRCQVIFARFFSDTTLSASLGDLSLDSDESGMSF